MAVGEEVNVFTVSARSRVGDAAGALPPQQNSNDVTPKLTLTWLFM